MRRFSLLLVSLLLLPLGCAPILLYRIETIIHEDATIERKVAIQGQPPPDAPNLQVRLSHYLELPDPSLYRQAEIEKDHALLYGVFSSSSPPPSDIRKLTPGTDRVAANRISYRTLDLVLFKVLEYEDRIDDIVVREDGERALEELLRILLGTAIQGMRRRFDASYDLGGLESYLHEILPDVARRSYAAFWEIRRARRDGLTAPSEEEEWRGRLQRELARLGLSLRLEELPGGTAFSPEPFLRFADEKLRQLVAPRQPQTPTLTTAMLRGEEMRQIFQESIAQQYGSLTIFLQTLERLLPRIFGAFLLGDANFIPLQSHLRFHARLRMPGMYIQTNGLRDLDGSLVWIFTDRDIALSGCRMWARSLWIHPPTIQALGLERFPEGLATVEVFYRLLCDRQGRLRPTLIEGLRRSVEASSLAPLEASATSREGDGEEALAAKALLEFLQRYRRAPSAPPSPPSPSSPPPREETEAAP